MNKKEEESITDLTRALRSLECTLKHHMTTIAGSVGQKHGTKPINRHDTGLESIPEDVDSDVEKRVVEVRVVFLKIGEIDTVKEKYTADVFYQGKWREPKMDGKVTLEADEVDWEDHWNPRLFIENSLAESREEVWHTVLFDEHQQATVVEKRRVKGTFLEYLELNQFPFDTQDLTITVSTELGESEVAIIEDKKELSSINVQSFVAEQEWHLHSHIESWCKTTTKVFQNAKFKHPALSAACKASRRPGFFIWNVLFVMLFICSLAFSTFSVAQDLPQNRLQLSFILLLTCVTFKFVVNQSLPKISYLTYLDKYVLISMSILCLVCIWHSIVARLPYDPDTIELADRCAFGALAFVFVFFHLFFIGWILLMAKRKTSKMVRKDQEHQEKLQNQISKDMDQRPLVADTSNGNKVQPV